MIISDGTVLMRWDDLLERPQLAEGGRSFDQLSIPRFVAWGALGGLVLGGLAVSAELLGAGPTTLGAVITGASTLLGAGSAAGTLAIAKAVRGQAMVEGPENVARPGQLLFHRSVRNDT